jgi:hypothetical protein
MHPQDCIRKEAKKGRQKEQGEWKAQPLSGYLKVEP